MAKRSEQVRGVDFILRTHDRGSHLTCSHKGLKYIIIKGVVNGTINISDDIIVEALSHVLSEGSTNKNELPYVISRTIAEMMSTTINRNGIGIDIITELTIIDDIGKKAISRGIKTIYPINGQLMFSLLDDTYVFMILEKVYDMCKRVGSMQNMIDIVKAHA